MTVCVLASCLSLVGFGGVAPSSDLRALTGLLATHREDQRLVGASRDEQAGWVRLVLTGKPSDIGYQYGMLAAAEIDDAHKALKYSVEQASGKPWSWFRDSAKKLFWESLDDEYRLELKGQVEGLKAKGLNYDLWDVLAFNGYIELQDYYLPWTQRRPSDKESCSAFVATGSATKGGSVVMGHNLWWDALMGQRFNFVLDIRPIEGHRVVMDTLPGFIHSGSDFAMNDAGILVTETTISGFQGFDPTGKPEFMRMRKATQYADSMEEFVDVMKYGNNGGYANTWLLADTKTGEIGKLELGLKNVIYVHKKEGYYVGSNFPEDPKLIREEIPGGWSTAAPRNGCEKRRLRWKVLLDGATGKVDADLAKGFLADTIDAETGAKGANNGTLCGRFSDDMGGAMNTKVTTSELAKSMSLWARMGQSDGTAIKYGDRRPTPLLRDIESQPWVLFAGKP